MPSLPRFFRTLVDSRPLPLGGSVASQLSRASTRDLRTIIEQGLDLLGEGMGATLVAAGVRQRDIPAPVTAESLKADTHFAKLLSGAKSVAKGSREKALVKIAQRALQAVAARVEGAPEALRLPQFGADGDFGREMAAATKAAQKRHGFATDGVFGAELANAVVAALAKVDAPDLYAEIPPPISAGAERISEIARGICAAKDQKFKARAQRKTYSYMAKDFGVPGSRNGKLIGPDNVSYGLRTRGDGYWKCNIFGGMCIGLADVPVPAFKWSQSVPTKHYFRAERFGPKLAQASGWEMVAHLDHRDPREHTQAVVSAANNDEIARLLDSALPGDLFFVDHPGDPGNNGGHTRVCVGSAKKDDSDHAPLFAQAAHEAAIERRDGLAKMGNGQELQFWLVRYLG